MVVTSRAAAKTISAPAPRVEPPCVGHLLPREPPGHPERPHQPAGAFNTPPDATLELSAPVREFLVWVARCPRTYDEAMNAWRSSCPRYTVWEDALEAGLIQVDTRTGVAVAAAPVTLSMRGERVLFK